jgi:DNA-binding response OmpR family regulator
MAQILLIDDDPVLSRVITLALEAAGHQVQCYENARKAVRNFDKDRPDLIVTDIVMPEMDGLELLRKVRQLRPELAVLAMSGGGSFEPSAYLSIAESFGAAAVLSKPFRPAELVALVARLLRVTEHRGGCHCGNLRLTMRLTQAPEDVRLRACGCSFCRAHNTRTTSDPNGSVEVWADDWSLVEPYRFDSRTAEFLICRRCGVYIGAICETELGTRAVINTNSLADRARFTGCPAAVDHDAETPDDRIARRAANWTPAIIHRPEEVV